MTTTINISNTAYLKHDGLQYIPYVFEKGGDMVRNPKTGEVKEREDKWVHTGSYHKTIESAIKKLSEVKVLSKSEYASLKEYVEAYKEAYSFLKDSVDQEVV